MKRMICLAAILLLLAIPVSAMEFTAPQVPDAGKEMMPESTESFWDGVLEIMQDAVAALEPDLVDGFKTCLSIVAAVMLTALIQNFTGVSKRVVELTAALVIAGVLMEPAHSLIRLGSETIQQISDYGKLLLPVMTAALSAQGGFTTSTALYVGTAFFNTVLSSLISGVLVPLIYIFLALALAQCTIGEDILKKMRDFVKWLVTWCLKIILYLFTGYMGITGAVSGTTDAAALKATKLTISGAVPVVGGILSDASEAVLVGAGLMKNASGIYGMLAMLAVWVGPFLRIGVLYLLLKITAAVCGVFGSKKASELIHDFSAAMGLVLGMTGSVCLLLLVSTVCFLKGVG